MQKQRQLVDREDGPKLHLREPSRLLGTQIEEK